MKKLYIKTYGCQMNVYDTQRMIDILKPLSYDMTQDPKQADLIILNTCHIREKAAEKVYSDIGRMKPTKQSLNKDGNPILLGVGGCVGQAEGAEILRRTPQVNLVFGPQTYHRLPELIAKATGERVLDVSFPTEDKFDFLPKDRQAQGVSAFLTIQEGCDKFCTFCVVPYTRGAEQSRPVQAVVNEAEQLALVGVKEITLLGQNVNAYHGLGPDGKDWRLSQLLAIISKVSGIERIRYTTSHPRDMTQDLIEAHGALPKLMPFLHLPVQTGSDRILKLMNRKHTVQDYYNIVEKLRKTCPDLALSSDFIVGFPGETDADFAKTIKLVTDIGFTSCYAFKYSPRPGTPAASDKHQVPEDVKVKRLAMLQQLLEAQQARFNQSMTGRIIPVLFDRQGRKPGQIVGRTPWMQPVHVQAGPEILGTVQECKITQLQGYSLFADLVVRDNKVALNESVTV